MPTETLILLSLLGLTMVTLVNTVSVLRLAASLRTLIAVISCTELARGGQPRGD